MPSLTCTRSSQCRLGWYDLVSLQTIQKSRDVISFCMLWMLTYHQNCTDKFAEIAASPRFNFIGNVQVGTDVPLSRLRESYDAILFAYGASMDKELGIANEHSDGIYSARAFVGWYNGLPEYANLDPDLSSGDTAVVIGQGNVALDVARILLSSVERLKGTDMTERALERLSQSKITKVHVVGRRGPLQGAFTIKEVRELLQLPGVGFHPIEHSLLPENSAKLPRAQKRIMQLFEKHSKLQPSSTSKGWSLDFMLSPKEFISSKHVSSILFHKTAFDTPDLSDPKATVRETDQISRIEASTVFRSIGYKSEPLPGMKEVGVTFDERAGIIPNIGGRVISQDGIVPGMYCAGWVKRGPTGVIATTMEDAFATAELIAEDWDSRGSGKPGWDAIKSDVLHGLSWDDWLKIDAAERKRGAGKKEREKFQTIPDMLSIAKHVDV